MFLSSLTDDPEIKDQDIDFTSLPLNEALQVSNVVPIIGKGGEW